MRRDKEKNGLNNFIVALMISSQFINTMFSSYFGIGISYFSVVLILVSVLLIYSFLRGNLRNLNTKFIAMLVLLIISYIMTMLFQANKSNLVVIDFVGMCILPFIVGALVKADYSKVMRNIMFFLCLGLPILNDIFTKSNNGTNYDAVSMGISYAILPMITSGVYYFFINRKKLNLLDRILVCIAFIFVFNFFIKSYRGALLCFFIAVTYIVITYNENVKKSRIIRNIIILMILILAILFRNNILLMVKSFFGAFNINVASIEKILYLAEAEDDISNGRAEIYKIAIEKFAEKPVFGHGMSTFLYNEGIIFPHNFFLQLLYDGGIIMFIYFMVYIIRGFIVFRKKRNSEESTQKVFFIMLMCISIPRVMVSAEIWRVISLWMFMGMLSQYNRKEIDKSNEGN